MIYGDLRLITQSTLSVQLGRYNIMYEYNYVGLGVFTTMYIYICKYICIYIYIYVY